MNFMHDKIHKKSLEKSPLLISVSFHFDSLNVAMQKGVQFSIDEDKGKTMGYCEQHVFFSKSYLLPKFRLTIHCRVLDAVFLLPVDELPTSMEYLLMLYFMPALHSAWAFLSPHHLIMMTLLDSSTWPKRFG